MKTAWPSTIRTIYGDHKRMEETYFSTFNGYYFTGDGSRRDEQGFYWITGEQLRTYLSPPTFTSAKESIESASLTEHLMVHRLSPLPCP